MFQLDTELLMGKWERIDGFLAAEIRNGLIIWPDNVQHPYTFDGSTVHLNYDGDSFHAKFVSGKLMWSDGDVWHRAKLSLKEVRTPTYPEFSFSPNNEAFYLRILGLWKHGKYWNIAMNCPQCEVWWKDAHFYILWPHEFLFAKLHVMWGVYSMTSIVFHYFITPSVIWRRQFSSLKLHARRNSSTQPHQKSSVSIDALFISRFYFKKLG